MWNIKTGRFEDASKELVNFYDELDKLCKKYNLSISHEDSGGSFIMENYKKENIDWIKDASINI